MAQLLPLAFRRFEATKGFKSESYAIALQDVIWKVFDYEKLRKEVSFSLIEIIEENEYFAEKRASIRPGPMRVDGAGTMGPDGEGNASDTLHHAILYAETVDAAGDGFCVYL